MPTRPVSPERAALLADLNRAAREASGLGTLFAAEVARRLGISQTALECLDIIDGKGRITAGELARATGLTTGAVTGVIDRLEKRGFARRERDPDDRRRVFVRLDPAARARAAAFYRSFGVAIQELTEAYRDEEIALFVDYFGRSRAVVLAEIDKLKASPGAQAAPAADRTAD